MNFNKLPYIILLIAFFSSEYTYSQAKPSIIDPKATKEKFDKGNYQEALKGYLSLIEKDNENEEYKYQVGLCYLNTNINKAKAIPYFEVVTRQKNYNYNAWYYLGMAYHQAYRFDDAIEAFEKFKTIEKGDKENQNQVDRQIQYCLNAKELIKFPLNVKFENLGKNVNSSFPDYMPFLPADESYIIYNSKRNAAGAIKDVEGDGSYAAGIYVSKIAKEDFSKAKNIGPPINNNTGDQEIVGMSNSGEIILVWRFDYELGYAAVFQSTADKRKNFKKTVVLDKVINSQDQEIFTSITNDGNTLYFSSIREGGYGGSDLYVSKKLPNETWGIPVNLGPAINTEMDEDYPNVSPDGQILYFSSNGHVSMGGFDVFKATWQEELQNWENVQNIGYPINTPSDDNNFRISGAGRYGYISALREDGLGDLDIYKVIFNDVEPKYNVIRGNISSADTSKKIVHSDILITVADFSTKELYGNYTPNPNTGNYIIIIPPGSFSLSLDVEGFEKIEEKIIVLDKNYRATESNKNFVLIPQIK